MKMIFSSKVKNILKKNNQEAPNLIINLSQVNHQYQEFKKVFPNFNIAYAIKSNNSQLIIYNLDQQGSFFETASTNEIQYLLENGIHTSKIIYSNPVKTMTSIEKSLSQGVHQHVFDSIYELQKYKNYKDVKLCFRIAVPNHKSVIPLGDKFGCLEKDWHEILQYAKDFNIPIRGLTFHVGSQCTSLDTWEMAIDIVRKFMLIARDYHIQPYLLNIGGGFPVYLGDAVPHIKDIANTIYSSLEQLKKNGIEFSEFYAEPGRFIVASSGILQTEVIGITKRKNLKYVFLNCGIFHGLMEVKEGIQYPVLFAGENHVETVMLCGPTCDSEDVLYKVSIPSPSIGDHLYFTCVGSYTYVYSTTFNGFSTPKIHFIDDPSCLQSNNYLTDKTL